MCLRKDNELTKKVEEIFCEKDVLDVWIIVEKSSNGYISPFMRAPIPSRGEYISSRSQKRLNFTVKGKDTKESKWNSFFDKMDTVIYISEGKHVCLSLSAAKKMKAEITENSDAYTGCDSRLVDNLVIIGCQAQKKHFVAAGYWDINNFSEEYTLDSLPCAVFTRITIGKPVVSKKKVKKACV